MFGRAIYKWEPSYQTLPRCCLRAALVKSWVTSTTPVTKSHSASDNGRNNPAFYLEIEHNIKLLSGSYHWSKDVLSIPISDVPIIRLRQIRQIFLGSEGAVIFYVSPLWTTTWQLGKSGYRPFVYCKMVTHDGCSALTAMLPLPATESYCGAILVVLR